MPPKVSNNNKKTWQLEKQKEFKTKMTVGRSVGGRFAGRETLEKLVGLFAYRYLHLGDIRIGIYSFVHYFTRR